MDELIFEEYKGTGNMELRLDRGLSDKRVLPAINILASATRRDELLYHPEEFDRINILRRQLAALLRWKRPKS
jgi:transcription termination factor Rho